MVMVVITLLRWDPHCPTTNHCREVKLDLLPRMARAWAFTYAGLAAVAITVVLAAFVANICHTAVDGAK
jgi:hypothetical protein